MKDTIVKAWPELTGLFPSLPALTEEQRKEKSGPSVVVSFESVRRVDSTGLATFLIRLLRFVGEEKAITVSRDCAPEVQKRLEALGAFALLGDISGSLQHELAIDVPSSPAGITSGDGAISAPVRRVNFGRYAHRREAAHEFVAWFAEQLTPLCETYRLEPNGLPMLLNEIAKNAADHAARDALFGMDVTPLHSGRSLLTFAFGDLGIGIMRHVRENLPPRLMKRGPHMSLYEAYRLALTPGFSGQGSSRMNRGHGMSTIVSYASTLKVELSVFDAKSRGLLSSFKPVSNPAHGPVRRIFHSVGNDVGFYYYGKRVLERRSL